MTIVLKKGETERAAGVGKAIGEARRAEQERQLAIQRQAEDRAIQWELEKAEMRSRQDFEQELKDRQFALEAENRAKAWQIEKMELASRLDFEQSEKERLRKKAIFNAGIEAIDNSDAPDAQKNIAKFQLALKNTDIEEAAPYLGLKPQQGTGLFNLGGGEAPLTPTASVNDPLGLDVTRGTQAPVSTLPQAVMSMERGNEFEVISPDGKQETISADKWPEYKSRGYVLAQIKRLREKSEERSRTEETVSKILAGGYGGV